MKILEEKSTKDDIKAYKESSHGTEGVEAFSFLKTFN